MRSCRQRSAPNDGEVDSLLMEQAILNLLLNAIDAMNGKGAIRITWSSCDQNG